MKGVLLFCDSADVYEKQNPESENSLKITSTIRGKLWITNSLKKMVKR